MKKQMKLSKMRTLIVVSALATTCFAGATAARYYTAGDEESVAFRTAYWDFNKDDLTINITNLFAVNNADIKSSSSEANANEILIAPGSEGSITIPVSQIINSALGNTETGYKVYLKGSAVSTDELKKCTAISYQISSGNRAKDCRSLEDLAGSLEEFTFSAGAGEKLEETDLTISWKWEDSEDNNLTFNEQDTVLGTSRAGSAELSVQLVVEQNVTF